jgi:ATP-dependent protease ClpP protease subunit
MFLNIFSNRKLIFDFLTTILLFLFIVTYFFSVAHAETSRISSNKKWSVFTAENPKECWSASAPVRSVNKKDGRVVAVRRGKILLMTTFQPWVRKNGSVTFSAGYQLDLENKVKVTIGSQNFYFKPNGEWAWSKGSDDDRKLIDAFRRGSSVTITTRSTRGTDTEDTFSLMGYTAATNAAAVGCGVKIPLPKNVVPRVNNNTCEQNASKCTVGELCTRATTTDVSINRVWRTENSAQKFITAAKRLGVTCGVVSDKDEPTPTLIPKEPNTEAEEKLFQQIKEKFGLSFYGGFIHSNVIPNALFFFSDVEKNDSFEFRKALRNHDIELIVLSSPGGSVFEGLQTAGIIHDKNLKTYIPKKSLYGSGNCASACSFMFFAGESRTAKGDLGVHQFYSGKASDEEKIRATQKRAQFTVSEIIGFLNEFETPPWVFERMFQQKDMYYFKENELSQLETEVSDATKLLHEKAEIFISDFRSAFIKIKD